MDRWSKFTWVPNQKYAQYTYGSLHRVDQRYKAEKVHLTEEMETKLDTIADIKEQRTFLIAKVILGQKLALDRCHQSYKLA